MFEPFDLIDAARRVLTDTDPPPTEAQMRRAISTAYYGLFHFVLGWAADRLVGRDRRDSAAYAIVYRGFSHSRMKTVCRDIDRPQLASRYETALKRSSVSALLRDFATGFVASQQLRQIADYDPHAAIDRLQVETACDVANNALLMLDLSDPNEAIDLLTLMAFGIRD